MYLGQGSVGSVITTPGGKRAFVVTGVGLVSESSLLVTSGWLTSGQIGYGVPDVKVALRVSLKHLALPSGGSVIVEVSGDQGAWAYVGTSDTPGTTSTSGQMRIPEIAAQLYETKVTLVGGATLERLNFMAYPASARGKTILAPLLLSEIVITESGGEEWMDTKARFEELESLVGSRRLISYQELSATYSVFVERVLFQRISVTSDRNWWNGTAVVEMKVLGE